MHHAAHAAHAARVHARAHKHVSTCCTWRRYDATCIGPAEGSTTYTFEWNDDGKIEEFEVVLPEGYGPGMTVLVDIPQPKA